MMECKILCMLQNWSDWEGDRPEKQGTCSGPEESRDVLYQ